MKNIHKNSRTIENHKHYKSCNKKQNSNPANGYVQKWKKIRSLQKTSKNLKNTREITWWG